MRTILMWHRLARSGHWTAELGLPAGGIRHTAVGTLDTDNPGGARAGDQGSAMRAQ